MTWEREISDLLRLRRVVRDRVGLVKCGVEGEGGTGKSEKPVDDGRRRVFGVSSKSQCTVVTLSLRGNVKFQVSVSTEEELLP